MKKYIIYLSLASVLLGASCSKVTLFEADSEEIALYSKVYMPRAERGPVSAAISTQGTDITYTYSAYLGGPVTYKDGISLVFAIDEAKVAAYNQENGTDYKLLPASNYALETTSGMIPAGSRSTSDYKLTVKQSTQLEMFQTYLLPLTINNAQGAALNDKLTTSYYIFNVTYQTGQVPNTKVLSLGTNWGNLLSNGARGTLIRRNTVNDILLYTPDAQGNFSTAPRTILFNWADTESFYLVNETSIVVRNYPYWAGLFNFVIDAQHNIIGAPTFWLGDFWDKYTLVPFKNYFLTIDAQGVMRRQPTLTDINATKTQVGTGFTGFKQILSYTDYLLAVGNDGKLWLYNMSADGIPGSRRQVGQGWDMYTKIIVSGTDILGLDSKGDVYRYKFDPRGFYPLK